MSSLQKLKYALFVSIVLCLNTLPIFAQTYSFTTAGATGRTGPTQAQVTTAYTSTTLAGVVTATNGIQQWTVPATGPYSIEVAGAKGATNGSGVSVGGNGAKGKMQVNLTQGQVLNIVVGQKGGQGSWAGGGGGASFVQISGNALPLAVAPGGGGGSHNQSSATDPDTNTAGVGNQSNSSTDAGGLFGVGISAGYVDHYGGGGAGWSFDGSGGTGYTMSTARNGLSLKVIPTGGYGSPSNSGGVGGFGGGGGGGESNGSGGGGGGYQGGNGGVYNSSGQTGGQHGAGGYGYGITTWLGTNAGDGYVTITLLCNTASSQPTAPSIQTFCGSTNPKVANLTGSGNNLQWYTSSSTGTALASTTALSTGTYYLEGTDTNTGGTIYCPSTRVAVSVTVYATTPAPTAVNSTTFYDGNAKTGNATVGAGLSLKWYAAATGSTLASAPTGTDVGTYTAWAAAVDPTCGESASRTQVTVTINPAPVNVTAIAQSKFYGATSTTTGVLSTSYTITGLQGTDAVMSVSLGYSGSPSGNLATAGVGSYTITPSGLTLSSGSLSNYAVTYTNGVLTINRAPLSITADAKSKEYDGAVYSSFTVQYSGFVNSESESVLGGNLVYSGSATTAKNVGTYVITPAGYSSTNYQISYTNGTLQISTRAITVKAVDKNKIYGDADPALTHTVVSGSIVSGDVATGALVRATGEDVGDYAITQNTLSYGSNYDLTVTPGTLSIGTKTITVTANAKNKTYGDTDPSLTYQYSPALIAGDSFTGSLSRATGENIGSYAITQNSLALSSNYVLSYNSANLSIGTKTITVTADAKNKTYGDIDPSFTYQYSPALIAGDSFSGSLSRATGENIGSYAITQNTLALSSNYVLSYNSATLSIGTKTITVTADAKNKTYGDIDPAFTYQYSPALIAGDSFTGSLSRATGENIGSYAITQNTLALSSNYVLSYNSATLSIGTKTITVTADAKTKMAGTSDPVLTFTSNPALGSTLPNGLLVSFSGVLNRVAGETAGTYVINQNTLNNSNYLITFTPGVFSISPATPTINASGSTTFCAGSSVTLQSSASTGNQWYLNGNPIGGATSATYVATLAGVYTVATTQNGLTSLFSAPTTVVVNPIPTVDILPNQTLSNGTLVTIPAFSGAVSGTSFQWFNSNSGIGLGASGVGSIAPFTANYIPTGNQQQTTATITVTPVANGCVGTAMAFTLTINLNATPSNLTLSHSNLFEGNAVGASIGSFTTTDPDVNDTHTYSLVNGQGGVDNGFFTLVGNVLKAGYKLSYGFRNTYSIRVRTTDQAGASYDKVFAITLSPLPSITGTGNEPLSKTLTSASSQPIISKGYTSQLQVSGQGLVSYTWSPASTLNSTNTANPIARPLQSTTYTVTVSNTYGSTATLSIQVQVVEDYNVTVYNILTPNGDGQNDAWTIENLDAYPNNELKVYDTAGRLVYSKKGYGNDWTGDNLESGTYFYVLLLDENIAVKKGFITLVR